VQAAQQQATAAAAQSNISTYQQQVAAYQAQAAAIYGQIRVNNVKAQQLTAQINDAETKLQNQKMVLSANLKQMYLDSGVTPLEMLASSQTIGDYMDKQQYQDKVKDKIQTSMSSIVTLQTQLKQQQSDVAQVIQSERAQADQVAQLQSQANALLAVAASDAAAANASVVQSNAQISSLKAQQAAAIAAASRHISGGGGGSSAGCGGYPSTWCTASQDSLTDSWGMYNRECVSYAAWAASVRFGHDVPYWGGRGNAKQWPGNARAAGIPVDNSPRVGDVAIYMGGTYGHAMIVESVNGSTVRVSSFNGDGTGHYSVDDWPVSSLQFIHF
jgi:surface antigen